MKFPTTSSNFKRFRIASGLSQTEICVHLGAKSSQFCSNIERGVAGIPPAAVSSIAKKLGISVLTVISWAVKDYEISYTNKVAASKKRNGNGK